MRTTLDRETLKQTIKKKEALLDLLVDQLKTTPDTVARFTLLLQISDLCKEIMILDGVF